MKVYIALGILWLMCVAVFVYFIYTAVEGYEDDDGYHDGKPPNNE
jgi:Ca2+/Na+ antiporter